MDRIIPLLVLALLLFASPLTTWWLGAHGPWYLPYLLWLGVIAATAWLYRGRAGRDI